MQSPIIDEQQVKYNAGLDIALTISRILKNCEYYARIQDFASWYNELKILERRLYSKIARNKNKTKIENEITEMSNDKDNLLLIYQKKLIGEKSIPLHITNCLYSYLANYENVLRKYTDIFGYGMPDIESQDKAILQR